MADHQHYTECQDCGAGLIAQSVWPGFSKMERARQNERGFKRQGAGSRCVRCGDKHRRAVEREKRGPALPRASRALVQRAWVEGFMLAYDLDRGGNVEGEHPIPVHLADDLVEWNPYTKKEI